MNDPNLPKSDLLRTIATVSSMKASGVVVTLSSGESAWLPGKELSFEYDSAIGLGKQQLVQIGDAFEVVIVGSELGGRRRVVSRIRAVDDPWDAVSTWASGRPIQLRVDSVTQTRAFGDLAPGVGGYVELQSLERELPFSDEWSAFKRITVGDTLAGTYRRDWVDYGARLVKLDIVTYFKQLNQVSTLLVSRENARTSLTESSESIMPVVTHEPEPLSHGISRVLIIDDSNDFVLDVGVLLRDWGISLTSATGLRELQLLTASDDFREFDLAIVDLDLGSESQGTAGGINAIRLLNEFAPDARIIVASGHDRHRIDEILSQSGHAHASVFLAKPLVPEDLRAAIATASSTAPRRLSELFLRAASIEHRSSAPSTQERLSKEVGEILKIVKSELGAGSVALFRIHPLSLETHLDASTPDLRISNSNLKKLRYSPVKDVALEGETIDVGQILGSRAFAKHKWLWKILKYESCIGVSVGAASEFAYALFVIHDQRDHFGPTSVAFVKLAAKALARTLELSRAYRARVDDSAFYIAGKSYGSMAHELSTLLSGFQSIRNCLNILQTAEALNDSNRQTLAENATHILNRLTTASAIVNQFRSFTVGQHLESVSDTRVCDVIMRLTNRIRSEFYEHGVLLEFSPDSYAAAAIVQVRPAAIEMLVYNLVLNAYQQVSRFKFTRDKGHILIEADCETHDKSRSLVIRVHDTGPGIHDRDREKVLETGFTTKPNGSGLGLNICREIVERINGNLFVKKSILFVGTTFEIRLPVHE